MSSIAYGQKEKAGPQPTRDRVVNVRFTEDELNSLDGMRGSKSRSEFLRDFEGRLAGAEPEYAAEKRAGCPDLDKLASAVFKIGGDLMEISGKLSNAEQDLKMKRWAAEDKGLDPGTVEPPDEVVALAEDVKAIVGLFEKVNLSLLGCRGTCGRPLDFGLPEPL